MSKHKAMLINSILENVKILTSRPKHMVNLWEDLSVHMSRILYPDSGDSPLHIAGVDYTEWKLASKAILPSRRKLKWHPNKFLE